MVDALTMKLKDAPFDRTEAIVHRLTVAGTLVNTARLVRIVRTTAHPRAMTVATTAARKMSGTDLRTTVSGAPDSSMRTYHRADTSNRSSTDGTSTYRSSGQAGRRVTGCAYPAQAEERHSGAGEEEEDDSAVDPFGVALERSLVGDGGGGVQPEENVRDTDVQLVIARRNRFVVDIE